MIKSVRGLVLGLVALTGLLVVTDDAFGGIFRRRAKADPCCQPTCCAPVNTGCCNYGGYATTGSCGTCGTCNTCGHAAYHRHAGYNNCCTPCGYATTGGCGTCNTCGFAMTQGCCGNVMPVVAAMPAPQPPAGAAPMPLPGGGGAPPHPAPMVPAPIGGVGAAPIAGGGCCGGTAIAGNYGGCGGCGDCCDPCCGDHHHGRRRLFRR